MNAPFRHDGITELTELEQAKAQLSDARHAIPREVWAIAAIVGMAVARALWLLA